MYAKRWNVLEASAFLPVFLQRLTEPQSLFSRRSHSTTYQFLDRDGNTAALEFHHRARRRRIRAHIVQKLAWSCDPVSGKAWFRCQCGYWTPQLVLATNLGFFECSQCQGTHGEVAEEPHAGTELKRPEELPAAAVRRAS